MATKNVTLVSKDGEVEVEIPETDRIEITNKRAAGWTTKAEHKAVVRAEQKAETAK